MFPPPLTSKGNLSLEKSKRKKPGDWLSDQGWEDIMKLAELFPEQFGSLPDDVENNSSDWNSVSDLDDRCRRGMHITSSINPVFFSSVV